MKTFMKYGSSIVAEVFNIDLFIVWIKSRQFPNLTQHWLIDVTRRCTNHQSLNRIDLKKNEPSPFLQQVPYPITISDNCHP